MTGSQAGWYPDPNDATAEVYWTGTHWHSRRKKVFSPPEQLTGTNRTTKWSRSKTLLLIVGIAVVVLAWACSVETSTEKECRRSGILHGLQGEKLDDMVQACVNLKHQGY